MAPKTTVLQGEFELNVDEKGRLLVPAEIRKILDPERDGEAFVVVIGINGQPWLYPERGYESLVSTLASNLSPGEDRLAFDQMYFSMAKTERWDKQGRLLISPQTRKAAKLEKEITMIGVRDHFELWNRAAWETRKAFLMEQRVQLATKQREAEERLLAARLGRPLGE